MKRFLVCGAAASFALVLSSCGGKPSAVSPAGMQMSAGNQQVSAPAHDDAYDDQNSIGVRKVAGKPAWASNRTHTAEENAQYQFTRNGHDFGAASEDDYVAKAHAFIDHPPTDTQSLDRSNGDRLMYDAAGNVFAVVSRDGAPRTMFKPRGGQAYWAQQKARETQSGAAAGEQAPG